MPCSVKPRDIGTLELKDKSVNADYTIEMLRDKVYPAAVALFPGPEKLQHQTDNARPHVASKTVKFKSDYAAATNNKIVSMPDQQAPRCSESNVHDLTVFSSMQDFVVSKDIVTRDELRQAIKDAWAALPEWVVLNAFRHMLAVHASIVDRRGGNKATRGT